MSTVNTSVRRRREFYPTHQCSPRRSISPTCTFCLMLLILACMSINNNIQSFIFVGAEDSDLMVDREVEDNSIDSSTIDSISIENTIDQKDDDVSTDMNEENKHEVKGYSADGNTNEDPTPLPTSLLKATRVGARMREAHDGSEVKDEPGTSQIDIDNAVIKDSEVNDIPNENSSVDEKASHNTKPPLNTGCHWGTTGCKKGKWNPPEEMNTNSSAEDNASDNTKSGFAGSAAARIEARVMKGHGPTLNQRRPAGRRDWDEAKLKEKEARSTGHSPPIGFKLAGRVVTSPSDGLSYFIDAPQVVDSSEDIGGDWMMTIPYSYIECGPTIESTTEAFSLADMVLRHFPVSASMSHWTNLGGGITIENNMNEDEGEEKGDGPKYIDTDGDNEGHPKLLVALSPIEITVSGNDEESRIFQPGDVILMEDTLGKGHKMRAAPGKNKQPDIHQDMSVLMVSLPHTIHFPISDWLEDDSLLHEKDDEAYPTADDIQNSSSPSTSVGAEHALYGFAPKHLHQKHREFGRLRRRSAAASAAKKPCPLEYDSAYSSLFEPTYNQYKRHRRSRRQFRSRVSQFTTKESSFNEAAYPPPPGLSTYGIQDSILRFLPSLRRTMLVGIGLSLTSSFVYCIQLLYPPLLVLWGGATMILGGALVNVVATRWSYRRFVADWEEEWRWKREVKRNRLHKEELTRRQHQHKDIVHDDTTLQSKTDEIGDDETAKEFSGKTDESVGETKENGNVETEQSL